MLESIIAAYKNSYCNHSAIHGTNWLRHDGHLMAYESYKPIGKGSDDIMRYSRSIGYSAIMYNRDSLCKVQPFTVLHL